MSFSVRVKEARVKKNLSQKQLANLMGVATTTVSGYERGTSFPKDDLLYRLILFLDVDPNYLFQDEVKEVGVALNDDTLKVRSLSDRLELAIVGHGVCRSGDHAEEDEHEFICKIADVVELHFKGQR